jgi:predicted permease
LPADADSDVERELGFHLEMRAAELEAEGLSPASARARALREFGDYAEARMALEREAKLTQRRWRRIRLFDELRQDTRHALRMLRAHPGFAATALLTLALGIGADVAMFAVLHGVLMRRFPYAQPDRLVLLWENNTQENLPRYNLSPANYADFRNDNRTLAELGAVNRYMTYVLTGSGEPERVRAVTMNSAGFRALGVAAALGRTFGPADDQDADNSVILMDGIWRRRFGGDPEIIGKTITLNGQARTVVGVMPRGFSIPVVPEAEMIGQFLLSPEEWQLRAVHFVIGIGRLAPGVSLTRAQADLGQIAARLEQDYAQSNSGTRVTLLSLHEALVGDVELVLFILFGAVGFVLLAACTNLTNLLLARAAFRTRELAVRMALGAGRARVIRQLANEATVISILGGFLGVVVAVGIVRAVRAFGPADIPRLDSVGVSATVIAFAFAISLLSGLLFGMLPALRAVQADAGLAMRDAGRRTTPGRAGNRVRRALVVVQVALAVLLVVGAGLLFRSFQLLASVDPGFRPESAITFMVERRGSANAIELIGFYDRLTERLAAMPGVTVAGGIAELPLSEEEGPTSWLQLEGYTWPPGASREVGYRRVLPGYFDALGAPVVRGRGFEPSDRANQGLPLLVNETFVKRFSPDRDPIGRRIKLGPNPDRAPWRTIIGVVADVRNAGLASEPLPDVYTLFTQSPSARMMLVVRTAGDASGLGDEIRRVVREVDPAVPVSGISTLEQVVSRSIARPRFSVLLFGSFAALGLILALIGTYGVLSYTVARRTSEIGVRMALGARRGQILGLVLREAVILCCVGIGVGIAAALALTRLLRGMLFHVSTTDPATFIAVPVLLLVVTVIACWLPAWRAAQLDPTDSLRAE